MQRTFGQVRNVNNRLPDLGYAMATGQRGTAEIQADITELTAKIAQTENVVSSQTIKVNDLVRKQQGGYCANKYNLKRKIDACQQSINRSVEVERVKLNQLKTTLSNYKEQLDLLQSELTTANEVQINLSQQGLTEEAVLAMAEGEAQATVEQAQADARAKESGKKTRNLVIALVVVAVVVVGAFFLIKKIRSKKKK